MSQDQEKLIKFYTDRLEKVKVAHDPKKQTSTILKERCKEYIKFASRSLSEVKKGRSW